MNALQMESRTLAAIADQYRLDVLAAVEACNPAMAGMFAVISFRLRREAMKAAEAVVFVKPERRRA